MKNITYEGSNPSFPTTLSTMIEKELNIIIGEETLQELVKLCAFSMEMEDTPLVRFSASILTEMVSDSPELIYISSQIFNNYKN